ncbi:translocation/assembly module TamB domain-containing protein [Bdellovibrio svalbardensis]|uniref:Translocation/assembly module TamB domain-containing protein n=1 Tax=Bdellovibrio svalbardensis TaxID=2972972 RepID=A0ABT6DGW4_9BACT|nr:translocation/assembly module TamB domain-containing protein [Bdellovibrio svalbardensis]MDG0816089.1 translocation/assembly module TamB domain-containing protein [Bdellovibrio svalbardensis]
MKRVFWILITPTLAFLVLWSLGTWLIIPRLETWGLQELQNYSKSSLPVEITAGKLRLRILRPSLALEDITITPKGDLAKITSSVRVTSARVHLDFLQLLGGRVNLSAVVVDSPEARVNIDSLLEDKTPPKEIPVDQIFAFAEKLPLQKIFIQNIHVLVESEKLGFAVEVKNGGLLLTNMGKNITGKADVPDLQVQTKELGHFAGSFDTHVYLTRQSLRILQLGAHLDQSEFILRGELTPFKDLTIKPSGVLSLSANIALADIYNEMKKVKPKLKLPELAGQLNTEIEARFNGKDDVRGKVEVNSQAVVVDKFELGSAKIQGEFKNRLVSISEVKINHPAGTASLLKSQIELDGDFDFKSHVKVESLDLQKLFVSLDLANIPAGMSATAELPCSGKIKPTFSMTCDGSQIRADNIWVKSENNKKGTALLNLKSMSANGRMQVTPKAIAYNANLTLGDSTGSSDGVIDFDTGFKISYKTKKLDFKNVQNLANLKMQGSASIEGTTEGNTSTATFDMSVNARDFIFEDFNLGNVISNVSLKKGHLLFQDLAGAQNKTQYIGNLDVDLNHDRVSGSVSSPTTELADVATILDGFYRFPMGLQGTGAAKARFDGPLNFWKLNYKVESSFKNVFLGKENFDQLHFNVEATNGNIKTQKVQLLKNSSVVNVTGGISSEQILGLQMDGKNWKLEESNIVAGINSNIYGTLNFSSEINDSIKNPHVMIKGAIVDTIVEDQDLPNSNFILRTDKRSLSGQVSLFGDKVNGEFQYPYEKGAAPLLIKMKTINWSYSNLLALVGGANLASEYDSNLSAVIDLRSDSGDLFRSTGKVHIDNFFLKRSHMSLANSGPVDITSENGLINIKNFVLKGPSNTIRIGGSNFTTERLNLNIDAQTDLRLLQIFMPFLEDLGGPLNISAGISGALTKPEILGTANLKNAYVKIKGFPHAIEKLSTEVSFSQSRILIGDIRGQIAGGTLAGEGSIIIKGPKDLQTSIQAHLENVSLNVPDKVRTSGNADLAFAGHWFPFTLSGVYHVTGGLVEKEFTDSTGGVAGIKQSVYLPKVLRESQFEPVLLDIQIILDRPLPVKMSLFEGAVLGNLQVKGPPTNPILSGRITADRKSRLIFKDKLFDVQNATIDFTDPNEINPNLFVTANSRINEYDITLIAQGSAKNLNIKMSSVPPLSDQDIVSLIALGVTSTSLDQTAGQQKSVAEQTGYEIGLGVITKQANKTLESTLGVTFDLAVTSQYDSLRNISIPKITLSRKLSERVKVSGSRPVSGDVVGYDVKLEYLLNANYTAIGSYENKSLYENSILQNTPQETENVFGLDLEFKREFK